MTPALQATRTLKKGFELPLVMVELIPLTIESGNIRGQKYQKGQGFISADFHLSTLCIHIQLEKSMLSKKCRVL